MNALVKAFAQAHRWQMMLDTGEYAAVGELAQALQFYAAHLSRILRLTLLAPAIVEVIVDGRNAAGRALAEFPLARPRLASPATLARERSSVAN